MDGHIHHIHQPCPQHHFSTAYISLHAFLKCLCIHVTRTFSREAILFSLQINMLLTHCAPTGKKKEDKRQKQQQQKPTFSNIPFDLDRRSVDLASQNKNRLPKVTI